MKRQRDASDIPDNRRDPRSKTYYGSHVEENKYPERQILSLANRTKFEGDFPRFQMPKYVGCFSLDIQRQYLNDKSQLRYLSLPSEAQQLSDGTWRVELDLKKGAACAIEKDEDEIRKRMLDDLLHWILQERAACNWAIFNPVNPLRPLDIEFVCFRGLLTMIMASPYEFQDGWTVVATKFQNTIYLWQLKEAQNVPARNGGRNNQQRLREMCMWGFKFEQYLCVDSPGSSPNPDETLNTNAEFCCIIKTRLAGRSLLYGAEVDALRSDGQPPWNTSGSSQNVPTLRSFVELKTTRHIETERQDANFRKFKLMKWWAQSFLVGIPSVICGYRDDDGIVTELEEFQVEKLRKMGEDHWVPRVMMNFCQQFLDFVSKAFQPADGEDSTSHASSSKSDTSGDPEVHYIFDFDPKKKLVSKREASVGLELFRPVLPAWYIDAMRQPLE